MLITDLDFMEQIVCSHKELEWEGWDVVRYTPSPSAATSVQGAFRNGKWYRRKVYTLTEKGWTIPDSLAKVNA